MDNNLLILDIYSKDDGYLSINLLIEFASLMEQNEGKKISVCHKRDWIFGNMLKEPMFDLSLPQQLKPWIARDRKMNYAHAEKEIHFDTNKSL